jgi:flagellar motility protein MotE (MotC chaperone)
MQIDNPMRDGALGTVAIIALAVAAAFLAGCQRSQQEVQTPNEKQARLLAAQSADLQKQLAAREAEIKALRQKHARELQQRDEELARCKARIEALQRDIEKGIAERVSGVTTKLIEENTRLRREVEQLKTRLPDSPPEDVP